MVQLHQKGKAPDVTGFLFMSTGESTGNSYKPLYKYYIYWRPQSHALMRWKKWATKTKNNSLSDTRHKLMANMQAEEYPLCLIDNMKQRLH